MGLIIITLTLHGHTFSKVPPAPPILIPNYQFRIKLRNQFGTSTVWRDY